ncbi:phage terminase large subunit-like protein [Pseudorhizobium tarimense]|uniref:Phage terminase large subunit-like protein n=1 Tax=Pseudorhizobium tarimense TaxID=1079109 RepID=A0ABV2H3X6_9HYPH
MMISLPQDPGQLGKVQAKDYVSMLAGVDGESRSGDRGQGDESGAILIQCEAATCYLVQGAWNEAYRDELCLFSGGAFKDQVDATSGAFGRLVGNRESKTTTTSLKGLY